MILLTVFTPLINFLLFAIFSTLVNRKQLAAYVIASMGVLLIFLLTLAPSVIAGETQIASLGVWAVSGLFEINWNFSVDALTYTMLIVVLTVSTLVHLYSTEYMSEDPHLSRFMSYLSLFTFFMLLLITSDNFIGLFLGWEGVGLCSYLLISFWFTRIQANKAAIKAMVVNRIADLAFTVGVLAIFYTFQTVEFNLVFGLAPYFVNSTIFFGNTAVSPLVLISLLLFLGAMGKSAQIGLHTWLPDAMEGWRYFGPSSQKILPYAGTTSLDMLVIALPARERIEKFNINEVNPQETDIQTSGSSETLRKTSNVFNFDAFLTETPLRQGKLISDLEWLVGFTEGGGSFIVEKTGYLSFQITQSKIDVQVLHRVRQILGFGQVREQDINNNTWRFRVRDHANLRKIILLFNGNLVLKKNHERFYLFVNAFNTCYGERIQVENIAPSVTLATGWLSGFTDSGGCFTLSVMNRSFGKKYQVQARFILAQKDAEKELRALALLISGKVSFQKSYAGHNLSVQLTHLTVILRYFRLFPLKTIKRVSLIKFLVIYRQLVQSIKNKRPLSTEELTLVKKKAKEINKIKNLVEDKVRSIK